MYDHNCKTYFLAFSEHKGSVWDTTLLCEKTQTLNGATELFSEINSTFQASRRCLPHLIIGRGLTKEMNPDLNI